MMSKIVIVAALVLTATVSTGMDLRKAIERGIPFFGSASDSVAITSPQGSSSSSGSQMPQTPQLPNPTSPDSSQASYAGQRPPSSSSGSSGSSGSSSSSSVSEQVGSSSSSMTGGGSKNPCPKDMVQSANLNAIEVVERDACCPNSIGVFVGPAGCCALKGKGCTHTARCCDSSLECSTVPGEGIQTCQKPEAFVEQTSDSSSDSSSNMTKI